jgi:hypothetical protein
MPGQNAERGRRIEDYLKIDPDPDPQDQMNFRVFAASWQMAEKWKEVPAGLSPLLPVSCRFAWAFLYFAKALGEGPFRFRADMVSLVTGYPFSNISHVFPLLAEVGVLSHAKVGPDHLIFQVRASRGRGWGVSLDSRSRSFFTRIEPSSKERPGTVPRYGADPDLQPYQQGAGGSV